MNKQKQPKLFHKLIVTILSVSLLFQNCIEKDKTPQISQADMSDTSRILQRITESEHVGTVLPIVGGAYISSEDSMKLISTDHRSTTSELEKTNMAGMSSGNKRKLDQEKDEKIFAKPKKIRRTIEEWERVEELGERGSLLSRVPDEIVDYILRYLPNEEVVKYKLVNKYLKNIAEDILKNRLRDAIKNDDLLSLLELLYLGPNPNSVYYGADNASLLHLAVEEGNLEIVRLLLLRRIANVNAKDDKGLNALYKAHKNKHKGIVILLMLHGAVYPLHEAIKNNDVDEVKRLLEIGADIEFAQDSKICGEKVITPLGKAIACENLAIVLQLLNRGAAINNCTAIDASTRVRLPLHVAAAKGNLEIFKLLLEKGADITLKDYSSNTLLHSAAEGGNIEILNLVLELISKQRLEFDEEYNMLQCINKNNLTPLHLAAEKGHLEIVKLLLEKGVDDNVVRSVTNNSLVLVKRDKTPLHLAAEKGHLEVVKLLLEKGADVNFRYLCEYVPLHLAACNGHLEIVKLLLEKGVGLNCRDYYLQTPLHKAAGRGHLEIVKLLLEKGACVNLRVQCDNTPLHLAACNGYLEIVKLLLEKGAYLNFKDKFGNTPLHLAVGNGHLEIVKLLLEKGANIVEDARGNNLVHLAAKTGNLELIKLMIKIKKRQIRLSSFQGPLRSELKSFLEIKNMDGNTPLHLATKARHIEVATFLLKSTAVDTDDTFLSDVAEICNLEFLKLVIDKAISQKLAIDNEIGEYFLMLSVPRSAFSGCLENQYLTQQFLEGKKKFIKSLINSLLLMTASSDNHDSKENEVIQIIKFLLNQGADVNAVNKNGNTPLHCAIAGSYNFRIVQLLLEKGANVHVVNKDGRTPLHEAMRANHIENGILYLLLRKGVDIHATTKTGKTPLYIAFNKLKPEVVKALVKQGAKITFDSNLPWNLPHLICTLSADTLNISVSEFDYDLFEEFDLRMETLNVALSLGIDINSKDKYGDTLLHVAVAHLCGHRQDSGEYTESDEILYLIKTLVNRGADINAVNNNGYTPLDLGFEELQQNNKEIFALLGGEAVEKAEFVQEAEMVAEAELAKECNIS